MSLSNSFHSSARKHAITSAGKLASVERHNNRGYYSRQYDGSKIYDLIGESSQILEDTKKYLNDTFGPAIARYNEKQKRADRRIDETPYEYFCSNKSLDIANEAIFQIGDKNFWRRWRTDKVIHVGEKELVLKSYPEEVKALMNEIYKRQAEAYEQIYITHGSQIKELIAADLQAAQDVLDGFSAEEIKKYGSIFKEKGKSQKALIEALEEPDKYVAFANATTKKAGIEKLKLISRIEKNQMHIKVLNLTAHYDEYSPHAHGVSVCWASDYKTGLSDRVAKSVVLNPWALTVIQDRMREIAEDEIQKHPEIFQEESLGEKKRGRNFDYSTEEITRQNQQQLIRENQELRKNNEDLQSENQDLKDKNQELQEEKQELQNQIEAQKRMEDQLREQLQKGEETLEEKKKELEAAEIRHKALEDHSEELFRVNEYNEKIIAERSDVLGLIQDYEEYLEESNLANINLDQAEDLLKALPEQSKIFKTSAAETMVVFIMNHTKMLMEMVERLLRRMRIYEADYAIEDRRSVTAANRKIRLDSKIASASDAYDAILNSRMNWKIQGQLDEIYGTDFAKQDKARYFAEKAKRDSR